MENLVTSLVDWFVALVAGMTVTGVVLFYLCCALIGVLLVFFIRIYIAYRMAKNRHRDPLGWVLLSFFFSPLFTWLALLIVGDSK